MSPLAVIITVSVTATIMGFLMNLTKLVEDTQAKKAKGETVYNIRNFLLVLSTLIVELAVVLGIGAAMYALGWTDLVVHNVVLTFIAILAVKSVASYLSVWAGVALMVRVERRKMEKEVKKTMEEEIRGR